MKVPLLKIPTDFSIPGISYMICIYFQGMNEIVGPIYYVFATDSRKEWRGNINILHLKKFS